MIDNRNFIRRDADGSYSVYNRRNHEYVGKIVNISRMGVRLSLQHPVEERKIYFLRIELPEPILGKKRILFDAECRWCRQDEKSESFSAGFMITSLPAEDHEVLEALMRKWMTARSNSTGNIIIKKNSLPFTPYIRLKLRN
jgi:hypothetical protein